MIETDELVERYRRMNESFTRKLVFHTGIDAGFFTEYTYIINAMLYCLQNGRQFRLYSADANYGYEKGWQDYFLPFCTEVEDAFHHRYNRHAIPGWKEQLRRNRQCSKPALLRWRTKLALLHRIGAVQAWLAYKERIQLNQHVHIDTTTRFHIPELEIDGDYLQAFRQLNRIVWRLNPETERACRSWKKKLQLPERYAGCQVRGGDKITETRLLPPEHYVRLIREYTDLPDVFVLTDDYSLFRRLQELAPERRWHTLCTPEEAGYVNSRFAQTGGKQKKEQMIRLLASVELLSHSAPFFGSITNGPSIFLLQTRYPDAIPADCDFERLPEVAKMPLVDRSNISMDYLETITQAHEPHP